MSAPKQGIIIEQHRATISGEERVVYAHYHYLLPGDGTARIITPLVTDTSMQLIIQTESGSTYRFDVLKETLDAITPAELTATPTGRLQTQQDATPSPAPSSEPTPLAAGGWMIERPWFHERYNLANAWLMKTELYTYTFSAGYEYVQNWQSKPKQGVVILKGTTDENGQEVTGFTEVYHLPKDSGAARITDATADGTRFHLTIQTETGKTYRFDSLNEGPQEIQP